MINLLGQRTAITSQYSPRGRREQDRVIALHLTRVQKEHTACLAEHVAGDSSLQFLS
jgi:hypothetical protein